MVEVKIMLTKSRRVLKVIIQILVLSIAHELGHVFMYNLLHPELVECGLGAWVEFTPFGLTTKYLALNQGVVFWVFAGGLIFTLPFLLLMPKLDWLSNSIIVGFIVYGLLEILLVFILW